MIRAEDEAYTALHYLPSSIYGLNGETGVYDVDCGRGLYSSIEYAPDSTIAEFKGEIISTAEYGRRVGIGQGGWAFKLSDLEVFDCYRFRSTCMASYANDSTACRNIGTNRPKSANCRTWIDYRRKRIFLKAGKFAKGIVRIKAHTELLHDYGNSYSHNFLA
jgi:hypothetical protein